MSPDHLQQIKSLQNNPQKLLQYLVALLKQGNIHPKDIIELMNNRPPFVTPGIIHKIACLYDNENEMNDKKTAFHLWKENADKNSYKFSLKYCGAYLLQGFHGTKDIDTAIDYFLEAMNGKDGVDCSYWLGVAYFEKNDLTKSADYLLTIKNDHKHYEEAQDYLDLIRTKLKEHLKSLYKRINPTESNTQTLAENPENVQSTVSNSKAYRMYESGLGRQSISKEEKTKTVLEKIIPENFCLGKALGEGDCFFDAVAQGINFSAESSSHDVKSLRVLCEEYAKKESSAWLKSAVVKDVNSSGKPDEVWNDYLARIGYTSQEMKELDKTVTLKGEAIWGRPYIEGRIICEKTKIKLHLIEIYESNINSNDNEIVPEQLIDCQGSKSISSFTKKEYGDVNTIHLVAYRNHFVPLLKKEGLKKPLAQLDKHSQNPVHQFNQLSIEQKKLTTHQVINDPRKLDVKEGIFPLSTSTDGFDETYLSNNSTNTFELASIDQRKELQRELETEKRFFDPSRTKAAITKDLAVEFQKRRLSTDAISMPIKVTNIPVRRLMTAEKSTVQASISFFRQFNKDNFFSSLCGSDFEKQLGWARVHKGNFRKYDVYYTHLETVELDSTQFQYYQKSYPHWDHRGDFYMFGLSSYDDILKQLNKITGSYRTIHQEEEISLAKLMQRYVKNGIAITLTDLQTINPTVTENDVNNINRICYHFFVKETVRWMLPANYGHDLPFATAQARALKLLAEGHLPIQDVFGPESPYGILTGSEIVNNVMRVENKILSVNKLYNEKILENEVNRSTLVRFFKEHPKGKLLTKRSRLHEELKEIYGGDSDTDGEEYDSEDELINKNNSLNNQSVI